jgi:hypothetical protein
MLKCLMPAQSRCRVLTIWLCNLSLLLRSLLQKSVVAVHLEMTLEMTLHMCFFFNSDNLVCDHLVFCIMLHAKLGRKFSFNSTA